MNDIRNLISRGRQPEKQKTQEELIDEAYQKDVERLMSFKPDPIIWPAPVQPHWRN